MSVCVCVCVGVWHNQALGRCGRQDVSSTKRVLAVVDGVSQLLQHHLQGGVLRQLDHEHAGLHADVARVWLTLRDKGEGSVSTPFMLLLHAKNKYIKIN